MAGLEKLENFLATSFGPVEYWGLMGVTEYDVPWQGRQYVFASAYHASNAASRYLGSVIAVPIKEDRGRWYLDQSRMAPEVEQS